MKAANFISFFLLALIFAFSQSCSIRIEKRRYNPGYHVELIKKHPHPIDDLLLVKGPSGPHKNSADQRSQSLEANNEESCDSIKDIWLIENENPLPFHFIKRGGDDCDMVYFKNGRTMLCTYIQITDVIFTYKECGGKTTDVQSIDLKKVDFIVLHKGDTIYPENEAYRWRVEHGETDSKARKEMLKKRAASKTTVTVLYVVFGLIALGAGIAYCIWLSSGMTLWMLAFLWLLIFFAVVLIGGGAFLLIMALVNALRH